MFDAIQFNSSLFTKFFLITGTLIIITSVVSPASEGTTTSENDKQRANTPNNVRIQPFYRVNTSEINKELFSIKEWEKSKRGAPAWEVLIQTGTESWVETGPSLVHGLVCKWL